MSASAMAFVATAKRNGPAKRLPGFTRMPFLGERSANSGFAARKAAYLAKRDKR